ncbi:DUF6684 family protein [Halocatena pleomorpha]|uniref:Uncharacterized protein n=1 Tax=Halocatena pleomorpha TaxID=1785090 RepID=A0A3P3REY8_9EURY|nr:DUF6684 family protein [Halocatena pleomorpha]RRJ31499.1 hypothetical protein EIK79_07240 [Halocatena pleomorpha]
MFGFDDTRLVDSVPNGAPLLIILVLTGLFIAYNPWGWENWFLILEIFGLHLVPILTLAPITYLVFTFLTESSDGHSETADRIQSRFMLSEPAAYTGEDDRDESSSNH